MRRHLPDGRLHPSEFPIRHGHHVIRLGETGYAVYRVLQEDVHTRQLYVLVGGKRRKVYVDSKGVHLIVWKANAKLPLGALPFQEG